MSEALLEKKLTLPSRLNNFIHGEFREPSEGTFLKLQDPHSGEVNREVANSDLLDVVAAIQSLNQSKKDWHKRTHEERADLLKKIASKLREQQGRLTHLVCSETGASREVANEIDIGRSILVLEWLAENSKLVLENTSSYQRIRPIANSVTGVILPWASPLFNCVQRIAPALATGGPVLVKPSHLASAAVLAFAEICVEAGLPPGVFNVVCGQGEVAGQAICAHPGVTQLLFAGRIQTAIQIRQLASEHRKHLQFSSGGRNAIAIFSDFDFAAAFDKLAEVMFETHRDPHLRGSRLFVQDAIYKKFLEFITDTATLKQMQRWRQFLPSAKLSEEYRRACGRAEMEDGKKLISLDEDESRLEVTPYVSGDLTLCSTLQQEEIIGPFVSMASFKYQHDAVKHINNSPLGQAAYVFTNDLERIQRLSSQLEVGQVFFNSRSQWQVETDVSAHKSSQSPMGEGLRSRLDFFSRPSLVFSTVDFSGE